MRLKRVLVAYSTSSTFNSATHEYLTALGTYSEYEVRYVNVTHGAILNFDINNFDVLFQNYCSRLCFDGLVSQDYQDAVLRFRGLKIISVQDDYDRVAKTQQAIRRLGFHVLITVIPKQYWPIIYPASELPGLKIVHALTGYAPAQSNFRKTIPLSERQTWVAYRGNDTGARYGRLGFEKTEIGNRMKALCAERKIPHDIETANAERIYGDAWFDFLGSSRTALGTESGSNAVDFDQLIEKEIDKFSERAKRPPIYPEMKDFLDPFEAPFDIGQISPRVFEYAAIGTPAIMFRGHYSGAVQPDVHYIALEKDFSNCNEILDKLVDLEYLQGFADRAYDDLIRSGKFSYKSFSAMIEATIEESYRLFDTAELEHRRKIAAIWIAPHIPAHVKTVRDAELIALSEIATEKPLPFSDFQDRQRSLYDLTHGIPVQALRGIADASKASVKLIARSAWMRLPQSIRYRIGSRIG